MSRRPRVRRPLRRRLSMRVYVAGLVALAVAAATLAVTFVAYRIEERSTRDRFLNASGSQVFADAQQLAALARQGGTSAVVDQVQKLSDQRLILRYGVFRGGTQLGTSPCPACFGLSREAREFVRYTRFYLGFVDGDEGQVLVSAEPIGTTGLELVAVFDFAQQARDLRELRTRLLQLDAVGVAVALVLGIVVGLAITGPVRRSTDAARRFSDGELDVRIPVRGGRELAELATSFNTMADRLTGTLRDLRLSQSLQRRFVADVSHELRTPLSAMVAAASAMDAADPAAREQAAEVLRSQTTRLHRMVEDLLEISRLDAGQAVLELETVDLTELCRDVVATVAPGADVAVTASGDAEAVVDARRVHTVLRNLVGNALRHGAPPVFVTIDGERADTVRIVVSDHGAGVPDDLAPQIFDRFVRGDSARGSDGTSTGLGLAIAAENARLHGGSLTLDHDQRVSFVLSLPRTQVRPG